jgi:hypothetical protein
MKIRNAVLAAALGLAFAGATSAQVITYNPRTGDIGIDSQLGYMNDYYGRNDYYSRTDRDYFVDDIVNNFGAPRYLVNDLLNSGNWSAGDVYYACALAYEAHRPCGDVARMYEQDRGQGWGVIAQRMGIKPGSAQFHALKGRIGSSDERYRKHRSERGPGDHRDGDHGDNKGKHDGGRTEHGPSHAGKGHAVAPGNAGKGKADKGGQGKGNSGKGGGKGKNH